ncbi:sulfatase/phosphatase domain-containing protein, partial [Pontiella sp.]
EYGHDSRGGLRDGKRSVYEGGQRVPFMVRWPAGIKQPGRRWDQVVCQTDLLATFADLLGVALPENAGEDSQSFAPVLLDPQADYARVPFISHDSSDFRYAITEGNWKLILPSNQKAAELYDLSTDRAETQNVAANHPEKVDALQKKISLLMARGRSTPGAAQPNDTGYWKDLTWMTEKEYNELAP